MSTYSTWNSDSGNIRNLAEELEDQQAMALAREAALNRRLRGLEGDMQKRVSALGSLVNALIEVSEVRDELTLFTTTRKARDAARALTRAVTIGDGDISYLRQSPDLEDVPGYWLIPAAVAIAQVRDGVIDQEAATAAITRDPVRAATYLVGVCVAAGQSSLAEQWWSLALPATAASTPASLAAVGTSGITSEITVAERALWAVCEAGLFTDPAPVRDFLKARLGGLGPQALATLGSDLYLKPPSSNAAIASGEDEPTLWEALGTERVVLSGLAKDAELLTTLERWAHVHAEPFPNQPSPQPSPDLATPDASAATQGLLAAVLSLVDEGAPGERDLIKRVEVLNLTLGRPAAANRWNSDAGPLVSALAAASRDTRPWATHLVAPVIAPALAATAATRVSDALAGPAPSRIVTTAGVRIVVSPTDDGEAAAITARERILSEPKNSFSSGAMIAAVAGVLTVVLLGIIGSPAWFVIAGLGLVGVGTAWLFSERRFRDERATAAITVNTLDQELAVQRAQVVADVESDRLRKGQVTALNQRVQSALAELTS